MNVAARNKEMHALRQSGLTYRAIAKKYGLSAGYTREVCAREQFRWERAQPENTPPYELERALGRCTLDTLSRFYGVRMCDLTRDTIASAARDKDLLYLKTVIKQEQVGKIVAFAEAA